MPVRLLVASTTSTATSNRRPARPAAWSTRPAQTVDAGGAAYLAAHLKRLADREHASWSPQGDLIGATPLISAAYHDEPTVELLGKLGAHVSAVGNHEFDEGYTELLRIMNGGCHPVDGCSPAGQWKGAAFDYLGANVLLKSRHARRRARGLGSPGQLKAAGDYGSRAAAGQRQRMNGVPIGFIGLVTKTTPTIVTAEGIKDLKFVDEVEAANVGSKLLKLLGVKAQVVLVHEGDQVTAGQSPDACSVDPRAPARGSPRRSTAEIDLVLSGHSHQAYLCTVNDPAGQDRVVHPGRLVRPRDHPGRLPGRPAGPGTSSAPRCGRQPRRDPRRRPRPGDRRVRADLEGPGRRGRQPAGRHDHRRHRPAAAAPSGESPLGNLIADAQLAATRTGGNAQIALMNPGGVRADLTGSAAEGDGVVTYGEAFTVQPFNNLMQVVTLTGAQLDALLEQQFTGGAAPRSCSRRRR